MEEQERCQLCHETNWQLLGVLTDVGKWNKSGKKLQREQQLFPIGLCQSCHHVQMTRKYTEALFSFLYFSNNEPPLMWNNLPSDSMNPYDEMLAFFADKITAGATITDFGCGEGIVLQNIAERYEHQNLVLTGIDFKTQAAHKNINFISMDLNHYSSFSEQIKPGSIDIALSSHVLEHVVDPIEYLKSIRVLMRDEGFLFIEVPDCEFSRGNLAPSNLIIGQHIHYYTLASLQLIAQRAGLAIIKSRYLQTNDTSRLQLVMNKSAVPEKKEACIIKPSAEGAISLYFSQHKAYINLLAEQIYTALSEHETVGLWGIGGDFHQLITTHPDLARMIQQNKLTMFDRDLAGYYLLEQEIRSSEEIRATNFPVFIIPVKNITSSAMLRLNQQWKKDIRCI